MYPLHLPRSVLALCLSLPLAVPLAGCDGAPLVGEARAHETSGVRLAKGPAPRRARPAAPAASSAELPATSFDDLALEDGAACREALKAAGAKFTALPAKTKTGRDGCGMPNGVVVTRGPTGVRYSPPLSVDCSFARQLGAVEKVLHEEARALGRELASVKTLGGYSCRNQRGRFAKRGKRSEHSFGNAADFAEFTFKKGRGASVLRHYEPAEDEPRTDEGRFLRRVEAGLRRSGAVSRVIGPAWDPMHRDHFHLDRGKRAWRGFGW